MLDSLMNARENVERGLLSPAPILKKEEKKKFAHQPLHQLFDYKFNLLAPGFQDDFHTLSLRFFDDHSLSED